MEHPVVYHRVHKNLLLVPILTQTNYVYTVIFDFLKINFNIILPSMPMSSKLSLLFRFPD